MLGLALLMLWMYKAKEPFDSLGYVVFGLCILMIGFGVYFRIQNYNNEKAGLTSDDELSKRIKEKAAAKAFSISIYMWLFAILFLIGAEPRVKIMICFGMLGMVLIFFLNWFYYSKVGLPDEN